MSGPLLAEFTDPATLKAALHGLRERGHRALDTFTPYPVDGIDEELGVRTSWLRVAMFAGGFGVAAFFFALQWYSSVLGYPINSGGRPLNSWPVFLLVPFEVGVLAAAVSGWLALFWSTGLPRLHHPVFAVPGFERATQDRFFLLAAAPTTDEAGHAIRHLLEDAGALAVTEVRG